MSCQHGKYRATLEDMFITFTNTKGGVGKSTLASHLAIWLFDRGYRVALLDTDPQGTSSEWIRKAESKITVRATSDSDAIQAARDELLAEHEFVVADAPGEEGEAANAVTMLADLAVLPLQPTKPDVRALKDALKTIRLAHAVTQGKRPETVLVLNCVRKKSLRTSVLRKQLHSLGFRVANSEIRRLDALADSCDSAVTRENTPKSKEAAADVNSLFAEILAGRLPERRAANE
jgi:chromosome partitioning protein